MIRINRYLSQHGVCSRREADRWIADGRVKINDRVAVTGDQVDEYDVVYVDDVQIDDNYDTRVIAYYKPVGVICTTSDKEHPNLTDVIDYPERLFPIGRLDKDSSGLLLLTNDGILADELMRGRNDHEKEYEVQTDKAMTDSVAAAMEQGVPILDTMTKPCRIINRDGKRFNIILTQGLNRQIRRMCEYFGYKVTSLRRIRFVSIDIGDLHEGNYRELDTDEIRGLKDGCQYEK